jgi:peptide-methionine (S)-S-oxide reductase
MLIVKQTRRVTKILSLIAVMVLACGVVNAQAMTLPDPISDAPLAQNDAAPQTIILAGGCFWGMQAVFQHTKGVTQAISGYAGGNSLTAHYQIVSTGATGHAESVQVTYDPSQITLGKILKIYFAVAHNPTELNYQGPDHGTQYRSAIFYATPEQYRISKSYIDQLQQAKIFTDPIVTKLEPLQAFYPAEAYHQDYARLNPTNPYIAINDLPKVNALQTQYPDLYVQRP